MFKEYFGLRWVFDHDEVDRIIEEHIEQNKPGYVVSVDGNNFSTAQLETFHMTILNSSIVNNCDGIWIPSLVNWIYHTNYKNYCGADLFLKFIKKRKFRQFYLGSNRRVLDGLKKEMAKLDPKVADMRFEELPFRTVDEFDYKGIAKMINDDAPDIIWVSLGAPKQEQFMYRLLPYLNRGVMFGYGAIFNFYSGLEDAPKRASRWIINMKMESLYRIFQEPKKQIKRCWRFLSVIPSCLIKEYKKKKSAQRNK